MPTLRSPRLAGLDFTHAEDLSGACRRPAWLGGGRVHDPVDNRCGVRDTSKQTEPMKAAGRQVKIRGLLESQEFVDLETICREVGASESSVRRDLSVLEHEGVLKRVYGGALAMQARDHQLDFA